MQSAIALIIFKRAKTTQRVFEAIRAAQPPKLLVIADGPRSDRPSEAESCAATRQIIEQVDWDCEVLKNYADHNMGCGERVSTGISWVFQQVEEAIFLEDDCLPNPMFFEFCEQLLEKYRYDQRVMMVSGTNVLQEWKSNLQSYHFSHYTTIWGWASWRRAWQHYDFKMKSWASVEAQQRVRDVLGHEGLYLSRKKAYDAVYSGKIDTWDLQWAFTRLLNSGLSAVPAVNLVSNIGFDAEATHTTSADDPRSRLQTFPLRFPLTHPVGLALDQGYAELCYQTVEDNRIVTRLKRKLSKLNRSPAQTTNP